MSAGQVGGCKRAEEHTIAGGIRGRANGDPTGIQGGSEAKMEIRSRCGEPFLGFGKEESQTRTSFIDKEVWPEACGADFKGSGQVVGVMKWPRSASWTTQFRELRFEAFLQSE